MNGRFLLLFLSFFASFFNAKAQLPYFQQQVNTRLEVTLDDAHHFLRGKEEMVYVNHSPDTLKFLFIHLWPNAYSNDHTPFAEQQYRNGDKSFYFAKDEERGFIDSLQFQIDGREVLHFYGESTPDVARINLPKPLPPGDSIKIKTPFRVKIPKVFSRLGHTLQAYFISQWFPKPAVYDRLGWHPLSYLDQGEFFSEYGNYDVKITLPENYIVMATGNLQNENENAWLDSLANLENASEKLIKKRSQDSFPPSTISFKTLHYTQQNVHDFAWFADKRWEVKKDTIQQADGSVVTAWTAFLPSYRKSWSKGTTDLKSAVKYYGQWVGLYPYETIKAVQGDMKAGGGMEYPTITVIDKKVGGSADVIIHEAGHNWFYGILGSNERDHAWMDEGINTFYEQSTMDAVNQQKRTDSILKSTGINVELNLKDVIYQLQASGKDQKIEQTSNNFREINYGLDVYYKTALLLKWLQQYMGYENFEAAMHDYFNTWKFKHSYPQDFRAAMERHTNKSINWFFEELNEDRMIDFSVKKAKRSGEELLVEVKNKTNDSLPVAIGLYRKDSLLNEVTTLPFKGKTVLSLPYSDKWDQVRLLPIIPDGRTTDNYYRRNGLFHHSGLQLRAIAGFTTGNKQKVFVAPALAYNVYDGFMAGLLFHNLTFPQRKFQYVLAPLYGFRSKEINGAGSVGYSWFPNKTFQEILLQADFKTFHFDETGTNIPGLLMKRFIKVAPSLQFTFKESSATSPVIRTLALKGYGIRENNFNFVQDPTDSLFKPVLESQNYFYGTLRYQHQNKRPFNPFNYTANAQFGENFSKLSVEGNVRIDYNRPKKALYIRAYAGKFIYLNNQSSVESRYLLNSTFRGENDFLYDDTYIGRSEQEGFGAHQISLREGGMKIATPLYANPIGRSDNWLAAINVKTDLPIKLPVRIFADVATFAKASKLNPSGQKILFDAGFEIFLLNDLVNIYVPVVMSRDYQDYTKTFYPDNRLLRTITFSIQLQNINWLKLPTKVFSLAGY